MVRKIQTDHVRGLTRETVVGLLANLTSLEMRRKNTDTETLAQNILRVVPQMMLRGLFPFYMKCLETYLLEMTFTILVPKF